MKYADAPHCQAAYIYACHAVKGHRDACEWERLACERFVKDLDRGKKWSYRFDEKLAERVCRFIERLPHVAGSWAHRGELLVLQPWQCFIVVNMFGWVGADNLRRFRDAYWRIPRKNAKSTLAAAIGVYMFCNDTPLEHGAEVYSGATTEVQANFVFGPARLMCQRTPALCDYFGVEVNAQNLNVLRTASKFERVIGNPGDGGSSSLAIIDEWHEHRTGDLVDTMETGQGSREQPLILKVTTAGSSFAGPCYAAEQEYQKLLKGVHEDDRVFCIMYGIDDGDDWTTEAALRKANPNYDVSVFGEFLKAAQAVAIREAVKQNPFKTKHLNMWVGAATGWLNMEQWQGCTDLTLTQDQFSDDVCIYSIDLASNIDLTAFVKVYARKIDGQRHYYAFSKFYLPENTAYAESNKHYQGWIVDGYIDVTNGAEIDLNEIQAEVLDEMLTDHPAEIAYDPWHAKQLAQTLEAEGGLIVEYRPTPANYNECMNELEGAVASGRFHHDGNPVLTWCASNLIAKPDRHGNIVPIKDPTGDKKIDGIVAVLMGVGRAMHVGEAPDLDIAFA